MLPSCVPPAKAAAQPVADLLRRLQDLCVIQLLLEVVDVLNNLFDTVAVSVDLVLESLNRWKPSSESAGVSGSLAAAQRAPAKVRERLS